MVPPLWKKSSQSHSIDTNSLVSSLAAAAAAEALRLEGALGAAGTFETQAET